MKTSSWARSLVVLALVFSTLPLAASDKRFLDSEDAKKSDDPQEFLKDYDKLVKGSEADWVYFPSKFDAKQYKTVAIKDYKTTGKGGRVKLAAEDGPDYLDKHIAKSKLGWEVKKSGADLTIEGNVANAWEPSGGARFWGGWMANPGCAQEWIGKDAKGNTVFEIRHKSRGSTISDAVENGIQKMLETLEKGK